MTPDEHAAKAEHYLTEEAAPAAVDLMAALRASLDRAKQARQARGETGKPASATKPRVRDADLVGEVRPYEPKEPA